MNRHVMLPSKHWAKPQQVSQRFGSLARDEFVTTPRVRMLAGRSGDWFATR